VKQGRLIPWFKADAATQMAVDEALFLSYREEEALPTLRFYGWDPPAISIGRFQRFTAEVNAASCRRLSVDLVRRPTGGRAVLHEAELAYALIFGEEDGLGRTVCETYSRIAQGLLAGLRELGIAAALQSGRVEEGRDWLDVACFAAVSRQEILVNGKKLLGSAQLRQGGSVLQHGSLLTEFDPARLLMALGRVPTPALCAALAARITSCRAVLGRRVETEELIPPLVRGLSRVMGVDFVPGNLTPREWQMVKQLRETKYTTARWNERAEVKTM